MTERQREEGGTLDLSRSERAPLKVKLRDGNYYDLREPEDFGPRELAGVLRRHRRAQEIMAGSSDRDPTDEELEEMAELLVDVAQAILPDAPRDELDRLGMPKQHKLIEAFYSASPEIRAAVEAATVSTSGS